MVERTSKFQARLRPVSGAAIWLIAPLDAKGQPAWPDLHLDIARAEEVACVLLQAVEDAVNAGLA